MTFVNPYTFISFPTKVVKEPALGHAPSRTEAEERYTGTLDVTWTLKSPLAIPDDGSWGLSDENDAEVRIPGSSVKGAVRSLHEALFAGCARIMDPLFTPVYRDMMTTALLDGWQLAVVFSPDTNVEEKVTSPVRVVLCGSVSWTSGAEVKRLAASSVADRVARTGDFIAPGASTKDAGRDINLHPSEFRAVERGDTWAQVFSSNRRAGLAVILVTDTAARDSRNPYYWATAKLTTRAADISAAALGRFRQRLRGADRSVGVNDFEVVRWPPKKGRHDPPGVVVGSRRAVDGWLRQGDVVWVKVDPSDQEKVVDVKLSLGWRVPAQGSHPSLWHRLPSGFSPCSDSAQLCLSCTVFGSVDPSAKRGRDGSQHSYGGHVRFGDLRGTATASERDVELAPLGTPHPGAGMYYLTRVTHEEMERRKVRPDFPTHWDSEAGESLGKRNLRGRKFYWHSDPAAQQRAKRLGAPRYQRQPVHENEGNVPRVHLLQGGSFTQKITFDGLDAVALASLLATLNPELILGEGDYALHLGRGKPLGLGSVKAEVELRMTTTADRYSKQPIVLGTVPGIRTALDAGVPKRCGDTLQIWREARTILAWKGLGDKALDVCYPTTRPWSRFSTSEFHQSFAYFEKNSGQVRKNKETKRLERGSWKPLPSAIDPQGQE
ncbi:MAG: RAMP superfamily CRISPR-associated protein [Propionibacterium sp.]|nr:RAMP superfamily CRISPR-associated protein [Propionibacterium sp.]